VASQNSENRVNLERAIINKILNTPDTVHDVLGYLQHEHFSVAQHDIIYKVIEEAVTGGADCGLLIVLSDLETSGLLHQAGGKEYIEDLYNEQFVDEDLKSLADRVIKSHMLREAKVLGYTLMQLEQTDQDNIEAHLTQVMSKMDAIIGGTSGSYTDHIQAILRHEWDEIKDRLENPGISGISTGFEQYDNVISGLNQSDLIITAARPSMGKSAWAIRQLLNISKDNIPTLLFSYEMSKKQISQRMVAMESNIGLQKIRTGAVNTNDLEKIKETYLDISSYPIYIDTNVSASLGYLLSTIRRYVRSAGVRVVFIDYVQLMSRGSNNETQELGRISRALKSIAMELGINVNLISQLNRGVESRDNKRPVLSDLRQSGNLEEDADIVTMLYRPAYYKQTVNSDESKLELLIRKNRNGPTGSLEFYFQPETTNICNSLAEVINGKQK